MVYKTAEQEILAKVNETQKMVNDIHIVIAGQPEYGQKGLKDIVGEHGTEIRGLKDRMDKRDKADFKRSATIAAISGGTGAGAGWGAKWLMATKFGAALATFFRF